MVKFVWTFPKLICLVANQIHLAQIFLLSQCVCVFTKRKVLKGVIMDNSKKTVRLPNLFEAILPVLTMVGLMIYVFNFSDRTYDGAHMPLIIGIIVGSIVGIMCGHTWSDMVAGMIQRLDATLEAILILLTVGLLISSFMISGTIPALIYYLSLIHI